MKHLVWEGLGLLHLRLRLQQLVVARLGWQKCSFYIIYILLNTKATVLFGFYRVRISAVASPVARAWLDDPLLDLVAPSLGVEHAEQFAHSERLRDEAHA